MRDAIPALRPHGTARPLAKTMPIPFPRALIIRRASDVEAARKLRNARHARFLLRVSGLPNETAKQWETKLNSALKECGCAAGAVCMVGAFILSLVWQTMLSSWTLSHVPVFLLRTFLVVIAAAGAGKALGLFRARAEIRRIENQLRNFESRYTTGD